VSGAGGTEILKEIERHGLKALRFSFADQHGVLRGKTLAASEAKTALSAASPSPARSC
jgi:glutamine synthetase